VGNKLPILEKITNVSTIPTLPAVLEKINTLLKNPQTSAEEIGKAITTDQALASKVLKLVNSAFYGFPGRISTITHAVVILGFSTIKNIVLTASIFDAFKKKKGEFVSFDMEKFWLHSISCGATAQTLAKYTGNKNKEECFIAGLIHDIGKIVICQYLPQEFKILLEYINKKNGLFYDCERELFDATHQEIGGIIAENWNLPPNLQYSVKYHHMPSQDENYYMSTAIVHLADILVRALDIGNSGDNKMPVIADHVWNTFRLTEKKLSVLFEEITVEIEKALVFMKI
jgi:HD-like signal output (HDOD) protein